MNLRSLYPSAMTKQNRGIMTCSEVLLGTANHTAHTASSCPYANPRYSASWSHSVSLNAASKHHYSPETKEENIHELGSHSGYAHGQIIDTENVFYMHLIASVHINCHTLTSCGEHFGRACSSKEYLNLRLLAPKLCWLSLYRFLNSAQTPQELSMRTLGAQTRITLSSRTAS
jgi:hypothetical protein